MRIICIRNLKDSLEMIQSTPEKEVRLSMIGKRVVVILLVILFFSFVIVCLRLSNPEGTVWSHLFINRSKGLNSNHIIASIVKATIV